ncbi:SDR family oxidoreductase [Stigmatella sp. ncwal1]|uniref:SDR family oxidoreductase n=1 Tax=Stigmatella ashevillensis TaxID=2995309 RepID=A0ABT5D2X8_9BACT|nr:SDR family oxidoreductase [Stigmatella ashevillena]MDC0708023.1 SDR family oxidoreductase [Stigmatella ashevillena]
MSELTGKVAFVTGGSRGIGEAIVRRLAAQGAQVVFTYVNSEDKARAVASDLEVAGHRVTALRVDSADAAALQRAVNDTAKRLGRLDIVVNNAGIGGKGAFEAVTLEQIDQMLAVNTRAAFVVAQAAVRHMGEGGRIISLGSNLAERVPFAGATLYAMSKSALLGFTRGLARDLGPRGITVNLVQPGATDTDMNPASGPTAELQRGLMAIPRYGDARAVAGLVAWLASPEAQSTTGASLVVDGGTNA